MIEVIEAVGRALGRPVPYQIGPRRAGDPAASAADPSRAKARLDWSARRSLDEIVAGAAAWRQSPKYGRFGG